MCAMKSVAGIACTLDFARSGSGRMYDTNMIQVKKSAIHGQGLFASKLIRKGTVIGRIEGNITCRNGAHVLWLTPQLAVKVTNEFRFVNHADEPNAAYFDDATVVALRSIRPGEEITHNYAGDLF